LDAIIPHDIKLAGHCFL